MIIDTIGVLWSAVVCNDATGLGLIANKLSGVLTFMFINLVFWAIGTHDDNMIGRAFLIQF